METGKKIYEGYLQWENTASMGGDYFAFQKDNSESVDWPKIWNDNVDLELVRFLINLKGKKVRVTVEVV